MAFLLDPPHLAGHDAEVEVKHIQDDESCLVEADSEVYGGGAEVLVEAVVEQRLVPDVNTLRPVAARDDREASVPRAGRHGDQRHAGQGDQDQVGDHFLGDCAFAYAVVEAHSLGAHRMQIDDETLGIVVVGDAAEVLAGGDEHRYQPTAPGLVAVGAASHVVAPTERRCWWGIDAGLQRQPDRIARMAIGLE